MVAKPHRWALTCLLCDAEPDSPSVDQSRRKFHGDLVAMQEHAMLYHKVTQDDMIRTERMPPLNSARIEVNTYKWRLPDGRIWLRAKRVILEPVRKGGD